MRPIRTPDTTQYLVRRRGTGRGDFRCYDLLTVLTFGFSTTGQALASEDVSRVDTVCNSGTRSESTRIEPRAVCRRRLKTSLVDVEKG